MRQCTSTKCCQSVMTPPTTCRSRTRLSRWGDKNTEVAGSTNARFFPSTFFFPPTPKLCSDEEAGKKVEQRPLLGLARMTRSAREEADVENLHKTGAFCYRKDDTVFMGRAPKCFPWLSPRSLSLDCRDTPSKPQGTNFTQARPINQGRVLAGMSHCIHKGGREEAGWEQENFSFMGMERVISRPLLPRCSFTSPSPQISPQSQRRH